MLTKRRGIKTVENNCDALFNEICKLIFKDVTKCYTCNNTPIHNGHFIPRGSKLCRWSVFNVRRQCFKCNIENRGEYEKFRENLIFEIGIDEVENLESLRNKPCGPQFIRDEEIRLKKLLADLKRALDQ